MNKSFRDLGIAPSLLIGLEKSGFKTPTEIQQNAIPIALENKDIIGQSETGTGKTLAYLIPILNKINVNKELQAIILAPTHELVIQIQRQIEALAKASNIDIISAVIIGNVNIKRQIEKLKEKPNIIIGTPGRIVELLKLRKIKAHTVKTIVIDEADRMLDKYNIDSVKAVIKSTLKERQLMIYSATISNETEKIAKDIMNKPQIIKVKEKQTVAEDISHMYFVCEKRDKIVLLRRLVRSINPEKAIVFINNSDEIEIMTQKLKFHKLKAEGLHGTSIKTDRKKAMDDFKSGKIQLLVASDIAARGLDIKGVTHIFNLDIPKDPKYYLHRAGRTGRAGNTGVAISIVTEQELALIKKYERTFNIDIAHKDIYMGKIVDKGVSQTRRNNLRNEGKARNNVTSRPKQRKNKRV